MLTDLPLRIQAKITPNGVTGCWEWTGCRTSTGYGRAWNGHRADWAHRVLYRLVIGEIPSGLVLDHLCRVRHCVNPAHLEPVTDLVNTLRGINPEVTRSRHRDKAFCKRGHPLFGSNMRIDARGHRNCRQCQAMYGRNRRIGRADVLLELANR